MSTAQLHKQTRKRKSIPIDGALKFIERTNGRFFSVEFIKRTDGTLRQMACRTGVHKGLKGVGSYDPSPKGLVRVWDSVLKDYRMINISGIKRIMINGEWFPVSHTDKGAK